MSISASLLNLGQLLKERICFYLSKSFPLRVDPFCTVSLPREAILGNHEFSPFLKVAKKWR